MMKFLFRSLLFLSLLVGLISLSAGPGFAQEGTPVPTATETPTATATPIALPSGDDVIAFPDLGLGDDTLRGPFETKRVVFSMPADWQLEPGAELWIDLETFSGLGTGSVFSNTLLGNLEVSFNGSLLENIRLDQVGRRTVVIPMPTDVLTPTREDGRHQLDLFLNSALDCDSDLAQPSVTVFKSTLFFLPHRPTTPTTDLIRLPWPIFQQSLTPDAAMLVVPDQPTPGELQAALTVAATFGRLTSGRLALGFVREGQLLTAERDTQHLIFVGNPASFTELDILRDLPAPITGNGFNAPGALPGDGVIQMVGSPWNPARVALLIGGDSDAAVIKAAQALSVTPLRPGPQPNLVIVDRVQPNAPFIVSAVDQTLADFGYQDVTFSRLGSNSTDYRFFVPAGQVTTAEAYFDLAFGHSTLADYTQSGLLVSLNDAPIGSILFSEATAGDGHLKVGLPPGLLRSGANRITVQGELISSSACTNPLGNQLWATLSSASLLHLPLGPATGQPAAELNLDRYPEPFTVDPNLATVAFVMPEDDAAAWRVAARLAFYLGDQSDARLADFAVAFADAVPEALRQERDLIVIGRPSQLPLLTELSEVLPSPFEPGSDIAIEKNSLVVYRLPDGASVAYLQLMAAPWNAQRTILTVLGNTDEALGWAGAAVTTSALVGRLAGNFVVINGAQLYATDTRLVSPNGSLVATAVPGGTSEPPTVPATNVEREAWLLPAMGISLVAMLGIIGFVIFSGLRQRRAARQGR